MTADGCLLGEARFNGKIPPKSQTSIIRGGIDVEVMPNMLQLSCACYSSTSPILIRPSYTCYSNGQLTQTQAIL